MIRRAQVPDELPGGYKLDAGQDIMISVYNIHRSSEVLHGVFKCKMLSFVGQMQLLTLCLNASKSVYFVIKFGNGILNHSLVLYWVAE